MPAISKQTLTNVLHELEEDELIRRVVISESSPRVEYELTDKGVSLLPVIKLMEDWGLADMRGEDIDARCVFKDINELMG